MPPCLLTNVQLDLLGQHPYGQRRGPPSEIEYHRAAESSDT